MKPPLLSVIIPTIDEEKQLPLLLQELAAQRDIPLEIIVADGGSIDATCAVAAEFKAACVQSERGRGRQMNAAARMASGDFLLFLHADSRLGDELLLSRAACALRAAIDSVGRDDVAGHFRLRFIRTSSANAIAYRYAEEKSAFNRSNTTNGDQGLLLTRAYFNRLGGFAETLPFLEDQSIAENIRTSGLWITLPGYLGTSARRFEAEGFHRRYILMSMMMGLYITGVHAFFERAPGVYRLQGDSGRLLLAPFFSLIRQMMRDDWGVVGTVRTFYRLGGYIRQNSWQMFFFLDVLARPRLGPDRYPFLQFHDRFFAPLTNFRLCDALTGLLCFIWFMGVLAAYFGWRDYPARQR
jgi:rSAM/selenodomain-associated transferase 2